MTAVVSYNNPDLKVEIDFTNNPTNSTRVWTDVSSYVRQISYSGDGVNDELTRTSPGTLGAVLDNRDGRFDSTNTASPYYPNVKRKRFIRVSGVWQGARFSRWSGLIDSWKQEWPGFGADATASISASSTMATLNVVPLDGLSFGSNPSGGRITDVLSTVFFGTFASVDLGITTLPFVGPFASGSSTLAHLLDVEETENGRFFTTPDGLPSFHDRHHRLVTSTSITSQATIGDQVGEIPYTTGALDLDEADLFNSASVTPAGGAAQTWSDQASINAHYKRQITRRSLSNSTQEALAAAQYLVGRYKDSGPRIPAVELIVSLAPSFWSTVLSTGIGYRYTWKRRASAHTISQDVFVERISETVTPGDQWRIAFQLSPAIDQGGWQLGRSRLDTDTRLVY